MSVDRKVAIQIRNLTREFEVNHEGKVAYKPLGQTLLDFLTLKSLREKTSYTETFKALDNVSLDIYEGEVIGIVGHNGSGKSTMLKIISRVLQPTEGEVKIRGRLVSLLEVGTGFHPDLTGRENIYFNGAILGMTQEEIETRMQQIIDFSEIEEFIDTPVKYYSSGMYVRLAFSVAIHVDPDILIVDEVLSVGDASFQAKCKSRVLELLNSGKTVLLVSHSLDTVEGLCNRAVLLEHGKVIEVGEPQDVVATYMMRDSKGGSVPEAKNREGEGRIRIKSFKISQRKSDDEATITYLKHGGRLDIEIETDKLPKGAAASNLFIELRVFDSNDRWVASYANKVKPRLESKKLKISIKAMNLNEGGYMCSLLMYTNDRLQDNLHKSFSIAIKDESLYAYTGIRQQVALDNTLKIEQA